jgi:hypothetical protein
VVVVVLVLWGRLTTSVKQVTPLALQTLAEEMAELEFQIHTPGLLLFTLKVAAVAVQVMAQLAGVRVDTAAIH